jgi:hypothetical protein
VHLPALRWALVGNLTFLVQWAATLQAGSKEPHETFHGATEFAIKGNNGYILTLAEPAP